MKPLILMICSLIIISCETPPNKFRYFKDKQGKNVATIISHMNNPKDINDYGCEYICYGEYDTIPPSNYIKLSYHCDYSFDLRWSNDTLHIVNSMSRILENKRNFKMIYKSNQDSTEYDFIKKRYIKPYERFYFCP